MPNVQALTELLTPEALPKSPFARLAVEAIAVAVGLKPTARFTASRTRATAFCELLSRVGMETAEYLPEPEEWGYRHATPAEREARTACDVRIYYARSRDALAAVMEAQRARDDDALGRALGYPDCCIGANRVLGALSMTDMVRVARTGGARDWHLNIFLTEMDIGHGSPYYLVSHFPCRLGCPTSIAYATTLHEALTRLTPTFARRLEDLLTLPVLLRDERTPPESRRYGNFGCLLQGVTLDDRVLYHGWQSLRTEDDLADAALDRGDCLVRETDGIRILRTATGEETGRLDGEQWSLVLF